MAIDTISTYSSGNVAERHKRFLTGVNWTIGKLSVVSDSYGSQDKPLATRTSTFDKTCIEFGVGYFLLIHLLPEVGVAIASEQTAHLQAALLHLPVRAQIRTAQPDSIRGTWFSAIAATDGLSSSPAAGLTCQMHLR